MDKVTLERIQNLHPHLRVEANEIYKLICEALKGKAICRFAYTLRTNAEQDKLYSYGRTDKSKGIVTKAKGGYSYHNYGLAIDIVLLKDKDGNGTFESASWETNVDFDGDGINDWDEVVTIFKSFGWEWGGDWKFTDKPHFQKTMNYTIQQLLKLEKDKNGYVIM